MSDDIKPIRTTAAELIRKIQAQNYIISPSETEQLVMYLRYFWTLHDRTLELWSMHRDSMNVKPMIPTDIALHEPN